MASIWSNVIHLKTQESLISDYDNYYITIQDLFKYGIIAFGYIFLICISFYRSVPLLIFLSPIAVLYPFFIRKELAKKRKEKLLLEFKDFLRIIKSFLEASYSIENCFALSIKELAMLHSNDSMMVNEIKSMVSKLKLNTPLVIVFKEFAEKSKVEEIQDFAEVLAIVKTNGGNISKIIANTINIINDKIEVKIEIETMTASKQFEQKMMNLMPFFIIIYMNMSSGEFLRPLYVTFFGRLIMTVALIIYFFSVYLSKKILNIEY